MNKQARGKISIFLALALLLALTVTQAQEEKTVTFYLDVQDSANNEVQSASEIRDKETDELLTSFTDTPTVKTGRHKVTLRIDEDHPVKQIIFDDLLIETQEKGLGIDKVPTEKVPEQNFVQSYAINPVELNFTTATVTATAKGNVLYKCKEWDFDNQLCLGTWKYYKSIRQGEDYTFELTPDDPGYGEQIKATNAEHLDASYNLINNIFPEVEFKDDIWSEPIYVDEYVRVTFEKELDTGNVIDVYVRSQATYAAFEIYEAGTQNLVGRSSVVEIPEHLYIRLENVQTPTDTFDLKIIAGEVDIYGIAKNGEPYINIELPEERYLEFDFIHDGEITSIGGDGILVYSEAGAAVAPRYREWNNTINNYGTEQTSITGTGADVLWVILKANHERDEFLLGTIDSGAEIDIQSYDGAGTWTHQLEITGTLTDTNQRPLDIGFEEINGSGLVVYERTTTDDTTLYYRFWDGTDLSGEQTLTLGVSGEVEWVKLEEKPNSNDIMLVTLSSGGIYAILWNGTAFDTNTEVTATASPQGTADEMIAFQWESTSGDGFLVYGESTNNVDWAYRTYTSATQAWLTQQTFLNYGGNDAPEDVVLCSDPTTDYVGFIAQNTNDEVDVRMWDGSSILASPPTQEGSVEPTGPPKNIDCIWEQGGDFAHFYYIDLNGLSVEYFNFTGTNTWSETTIDGAATSAAIGGDDITKLDAIQHPLTDEIMIMTIDQAENLAILIHNSTGLAEPSTSPLETGTECVNLDQQCGMFDWNRFDPVPNVTNVLPSGTNFAKNIAINITANVTDNINVSVVLANITLPNATVVQIELQDLDGNNEFNETFSITDLGGTYTVRIIANDTSIHENVNSTETNTFTIGDFVAPNFTFIAPNNSQSFSANINISIEVNVTDDIEIDTVLANVTLPNATVVQIILSNITLNSTEFPATYQGNVSMASDIGNYVIKMIINDTENNLNDTEVRNFSIGDTTNPLVIDLFPPTGTSFTASAAVNISANVTDDVAVDAVLANVTLPDGSITQLNLTDVDSDFVFNASFTDTTQSGTYTLKIIANDTANNLNDTETTTFTVGDSDPPSILLSEPEDFFNTSSGTVSFNFTALDETDTSLNCTLFIDNVLRAVNTTTGNGTLTPLTPSTVAQGIHDWNITCNDDTPNFNSSVVRNFTVDTTNPSFISLTTAPNTEDDLDPGVRVNVTANVTDNLVGVDIVILQYQNLTDTIYTNLTMTLNGTNGLYNATFVAVGTTNYTLRIVANDSVSNRDTSATIQLNISDDRTWTRTPSSFAAIVTDLNTNVSIGNLTIVNIGDVALNFSVTSTLNDTSFNDSFTTVEVAAKANYTLQVNASTNVGGVIPFTISVNASTNADPVTLDSSATIVVAEGQPVLSLTLDSFPTEVTADGSTLYNIEATLTNLGEGNATNVTFYYDLDDDWTVTSGNTNLSFSEVISGDSEESDLTIRIPTNTTTGSRPVLLNATGVNGTAINLHNEGLIISTGTTVTVNAEASLGSGSTGGESGGGGGSGGSGSSGGGGGSVSRAATGETIYTTETFTLVRGGQEGLPFTVSNLYENAILQNIQLEVQGFMSQHVSIEPILDATKQVHVETNRIRFVKVGEKIPFVLTGLGGHTLTATKREENRVDFLLESEPVTFSLNIGETQNIDQDKDGIADMAFYLKEITEEGHIHVEAYKLGSPEAGKLHFKEARDYLLTIFAPSYLAQEDYKLTIKITSDLVAIDPTKAGFGTRPLVEYRTLVFKVLEVSEKNIEEQYVKAKEQVQEMQEAGFGITQVKNYLTEAQEAITQTNYAIAAKRIGEIKQYYENSFAADNIIKGLEKNIAKAQNKWLEVPETKKALSLAQTAFEREDYETALQRAKDAQLTYILETKGRINLLWFFKTYWWAIILGSILAIFIGFFTYKRLTLQIIAQRLKNLGKEGTALNELLKETQMKHFKEGSISSQEYHQIVAQYEKRLDIIKKLQIKLRNKRVSILKTEQELANIDKEQEEILGSMKEEQKAYLQKGTLSRKQFLRQYKADKERYTDIVEEKELLKEKLAKERGTKKYHILRALNTIITSIQTLFKRKEKKDKRRKDLAELYKKEERQQPTLQEQKQERKQRKETKKEKEQFIRSKKKSMVQALQAQYAIPKQPVVIPKKKEERVMQRPPQEPIAQKINTKEFIQNQENKKPQQTKQQREERRLPTPKEESERKRKEINKMLKDEYGLD